MKLNWKEITEQNKAGGKGEMTLRFLLGEKELGDKCGLFAQVTIEVGSSLGVHEHHGNAETYYILSGKGLYIDDDERYEVGAGDVTYCLDGHAHGLENIGDEPLVFMALIINS